tara:strand:+ start:106 stop:243 length:138 start_codon:yes stop_codon:yes gene_type:complete
VQRPHEEGARGLHALEIVGEDLVRVRVSVSVGVRARVRVRVRGMR